MKLSKNNKIAIPPNPPWITLDVQEISGGYLSYFYNDDLSLVPVRAITKIRDNKVDPNMETQTYGLFSPCNKNMRKSIVRRGCSRIFFVTNRKTVRVLVGIYFLKWYAEIPQEIDDFCLAANHIWFVENPIPLSQIDKVCGINISRKFRTHLRVDIEECKKIEDILLRKPNATKMYLSEIDRLERFNLKHSGYRYASGRIREKYSWDCTKLKCILRNAVKKSSKNL